MKELVYWNGDLLASDDVRFCLSPTSALYGKGVFTTVALHKGEPLLWQKHWRRLKENAGKLGIDLSEFSEERTRESLCTLAEENSVQDGRARVTFFDGSASKLWQVGSDHRPDLLIVTGDLQQLPTEFRITVSRYPVSSVSPLSGVKSCNYLDPTIAKSEARQRGFDECVRVNERGEVVSAAMANIFWLRNDQLYTPRIETGCLAGTTRSFVLENLECEEVAVDIEELTTADQIFLTSAGLGITRVGAVDKRELQTASHPIMELIPQLT